MAENQNVKFIVENGRYAGSVIELAVGQEYSLGKSFHCDIAIDDPRFAERQMLLRVSEEGVQIKLLAEGNLSVNGEAKDTQAQSEWRGIDPTAQFSMNDLNFTLEAEESLLQAYKTNQEQAAQDSSKKAADATTTEEPELATADTAQTAAQASSNKGQAKRANTATANTPNANTPNANNRKLGDDELDFTELETQVPGDAGFSSVESEQQSQQTADDSINTAAVAKPQRHATDYDDYDNEDDDQQLPPWQQITDSKYVFPLIAAGIIVIALLIFYFFGGSSVEEPTDTVTDKATESNRQIERTAEQDSATETETSDNQTTDNEATKNQATEDGQADSDAFTAYDNAQRSENPLIKVGEVAQNQQADQGIYGSNDRDVNNWDITDNLSKKEAMKLDRIAKNNEKDITKDETDPQQDNDAANDNNEQAAQTPRVDQRQLTKADASEDVKPRKQARLENKLQRPQEANTDFKDATGEEIMRVLSGKASPDLIARMSVSEMVAGLGLRDLRVQSRRPRENEQAPVVVVTGYAAYTEAWQRAKSIIESDIRGIGTLVDNVSTPNTRKELLDDWISNSSVANKVQTYLSDRGIVAKANLTRKQAAVWKTISNRYIKEFNNQPALFVMRDPGNWLKLKSISFGAKPYIVTDDNTIIMQGAKLANGYEVMSIRREGIELRDAFGTYTYVF